MSEENLIFKILPSVKKICEIVDKSLHIYNPILGGIVTESANVRANEPLYGNQTMLSSEVDEMGSVIDPGIKGLSQIFIFYPIQR